MSSITSSYRAAQNLERQGFKFYHHDEFSRDRLDTPISAVDAVSRLRQERYDRGQTWDAQAKVRIAVPDSDTPIPVANESHLTALDQLYSDEPISPPTTDQDHLRGLAEEGCAFRSGDEDVSLGQLYWRVAGAGLPGYYRDGEGYRSVSIRDDVRQESLVEPVYLRKTDSQGYRNLSDLVETLDRLPDVNELRERLPEALNLTPMREKKFVKRLVGAATNPVARLDVLKLISPVRFEGQAAMWANAVAVLPLDSAIRIGTDLIDPESRAGAAVMGLHAATENPSVRRMVPEMMRLAMERPDEATDRLLGRLYLRAKAGHRLSSLRELVDELHGEKGQALGWKLPEAYLEAREFCERNPNTGIEPLECLKIGAKFTPEGILFDSERGEELDFGFEEDLIEIGDQVIFLDAL